MMINREQNLTLLILILLNDTNVLPGLPLSPFGPGRPSIPTNPCRPLGPSGPGIPGGPMLPFGPRHLDSHGGHCPPDKLLFNQKSLYLTVNSRNLLTIYACVYSKYLCLSITYCHLISVNRNDNNSNYSFKM